MPDKIFITWTQIQEASRLIADNARDMEYKAVIGIQRGGLIPAVIISHELDIPMYSVNCSLRDHVNKPTMIHDIPHGRYLCVDDINDTGETLSKAPGAYWATLHHKSTSKFQHNFYAKEVGEQWIVYPWEKEDSETIQDYLK